MPPFCTFSFVLHFTLDFVRAGGQSKYLAQIHQKRPHMGICQGEKWKNVTFFFTSSHTKKVRLILWFNAKSNR